MADIVVITRRVRRKVFDYDAPQFYDDDWYVDAIDDGLGRLNMDLGSTYTVSSLPSTYEWLLVLLGAINMCGIRALENHQDPDATDAIVGTVRRVEVDGLETEFFDKSTSTPTDWLAYCKALEAQYEKWLEETPSIESNTPTVQVATVLREDLRNNRGLKNYAMDSGVDVSSMAPAISSVDDGVLLTWAAVYSTQFAAYTIQRKISTGDWNDVDDVTNVASLADNHTIRFVDTNALDLTPATYNYRIAVSNRNGIKTYSSELTVVIS